MLTNNKNFQSSLFKLNRNFLLLVFALIFTQLTNAQCAMCRASLESAGDTTQAQAVNDGIVYLMAIPYILVAIIGFAIYKMYYKK